MNPQLAPGTLFAIDYRVASLLARGGMGEVYAAEQLSTGRRRALKVLRTELYASDRDRARFAREARATADVASDHLVEVIGAGVDPGTRLPWLAMELLEGLDLAQLAARRGRLARGELAELLAQLCHGLGAAHAVGLVHRDLKPENVFVARARHYGVPFTAKLLDFGIATLVADLVAATTAHGAGTDAARAATTRGGGGGTAAVTAASGSPLWMAPEQVRGQAVSPRTDVWALGLLAFWALAGRPFWRASGRGMIASLVMEKFADPLPTASARAAEYGEASALPRGFDAWFARCVAHDPAARFADAGAAWAALEPLLRAHGTP